MPSFAILNGVNIKEAMIGSLNLILAYDSETHVGLMMKVLFMLMLSDLGAVASLWVL